MSQAAKDANARWGRAWLALAGALAVHVIDEALTGFLPVYNGLVSGLRERYGFFPMPTFSFEVWLGGLCALVATLFALSPLVFAGRRWLRWAAYPLSVIMILNAIGHITASLAWGTLAPGVYSSPFLLAAAVALLVTTRSASLAPREMAT